MTTAVADPVQAQPRAAAAAARPAAAAGKAPVPRHDIYVNIHRALRLFMTDTLARLSWLDCGDATELQATLSQLDALLATCRSHLQHENNFVHPAIEARQPGGTRRIGGEHAEHLDEIAALQAEAAALRVAPSGPLALRLYRHLALFVADNFQHMQVEEAAHNELLWSAYSDDEILAIEQRLVASLAPAEQAMMLRWMTPALPPAERAAWFGGMRMQMPPEVFEQVLYAARGALDDTAWAKLARALGVAPVPGLVTV